MSALTLIVAAAALQPQLTARLRCNALRAEPGGPPPGVATGGPPRGPPPGVKGGPPGGPPKKQRDETNPVVDAAVDALFSLLYVGDDSGAADSSKNLRVLWTRAVLSGRGIIDDPQAFEWLPTNTRWLVSPENAKRLPESLIEKLEWIGSRTRFLDKAVDAFLDDYDSPQIVVVGAGYDTRCARYGGRAKFFEVDLPSAVDAKKRILAKRSPSITVEHLPLNLEDLKAGPSLPERLASSTSFNPQKPTLYVFEAVLFYLSPPACSALLDAALTQGARVALTDSLTKLGVAPRGPAPPPNKAACAEFFSNRGGALGAHDVRWGGALHYADVVASTA